MGFLELRRQCGFSHEVRRGSQGASPVEPGKSGLHVHGEGKRVIALESWEVNRASRHVEEGLSRAFSSCGRKPRVPSTCACDCRELLRVPLRSQAYCGVGRGLSGLHWVWCNGRGPHPDLRQEPQVSSPVLMWASCCVCHFKQGVRCRRVWRDGTLLSPRFVKGVSGLQPS